MVKSKTWLTMLKLVTYAQESKHQGQSLYDCAGLRYPPFSTFGIYTFEALCQIIYSEIFISRSPLPVSTR